MSGMNRRPAPPFGANKACWQAQGLLGWWPIGNWLFNDYVGRNHLTRSGTPVFSLAGASEQGLCAQTTGSSDYAVITTATGLGVLENAFTMAFWFYTTTGVNSGQVFTIGTGSAGHNLNYAGVFTWKRGTNGNTIVSTTTSYTDYSARHIAITYDGTTALIYNNSKQEASASSPTIDTGTISRVGLFVNSHSGFPESPSAANIWAADLRFYRRALSANEIKRLYSPQERWQLYQTFSPNFHWALQAAAAANTKRAYAIFID